MSDTDHIKLHQAVHDAMLEKACRMQVLKQPTRRDLFVSSILQGMLSSGIDLRDRSLHEAFADLHEATAMADRAVTLADLVIARMDQDEEMDE